MTRVAIHQPNYAPWLGYFHKMAHADLFVFLDDTQFSKGSYTNRVQIAGTGGPRWLTIPVVHAFGAPIDRICIARIDWSRAHLDTLRTCYRRARCFTEIWPDLQAMYSDLPQASLADANIALIRRLAEHLGITTPLRRSSDIDGGGATGVDRLIALCRKLGDRVEYLSGRGGAKYQDEGKFVEAAVPLRYTTFEHPRYPQSSEAFLAGLSILDAVFHLGWKGAAALVKP